MPQAGFDPPEQSHASYEASAILPSHHGWIAATLIHISLFCSCFCSKLYLCAKSSKVIKKENYDNSNLQFTMSQTTPK